MRKIVIILTLCIVSKAWGSKISDAYEALSIFDYFKAKQLFYKTQSKLPSESAFGLANIYYRTDNPFSNIDSAAKYISICKIHFKDSSTYSKYHINFETIDSLSKKIVDKGFATYCYGHSVKNLNYFLSHFYFADNTLINKAINDRDGLKLEQAISYKSSDSINLFLLNYPQSNLYSSAKNTFYSFQYAEQTPNKTETELQLFIKKHPNNPNIHDAEITLYKIVEQYHSADSLYGFITKYSTALTRESAWKLLYSTSVKSYSKEELNVFLKKYPDYPFNETIQKEIALSQNILIPLQNLDDKYGYIDTVGNWVISPQFDDAFTFSEGFAVVAKNNFYYYINKEGDKTSDLYNDEIESYVNGVAIIKKEHKSYLINRAGQIISKGYDDLNEMSDNLFTCRVDQTSGAINIKGETVIPFIYESLGKFKKGFSYYGIYDSSEKIGLITSTNTCLKIEWDWISEVDTNNMFIVKNNKKFGLLNVNEQLILPTEYDYIVHCQNEIYLVVKNNLYGFYNIKDQCFATSVEYNYNSSYDPSDYTNGKYFKLIKDNEVALVDANGRYSINFGNYSDLFFAKCDIIRAQKNNKFGFIDRKLKSITPFEYDKATDFENNIAIVSKGSNFFLIDNFGKILYTIKDGSISGMLNKLSTQIPRSQNQLFSIYKNQLFGLLDIDGKELLRTEFESVHFIYGQLYACVKNNELYLFNLKTKTLKKI